MKRLILQWICSWSMERLKNHGNYFFAFSWDGEHWNKVLTDMPLKERHKIIITGEISLQKNRAIYESYLTKE